MAFQVLARKYRPLKFSEIVGQEGTIQALTNGLRLQRIPAAVIFSGVRGTGKTTLARLFAKALNCQLGPTPEPCGECDSCLAIALSSHEDVLEIDGASHTGIDEIRDLQDSMAYATRRSPFKIYLIDEVHMLSMSAFNALLKTIEEPPPQVRFIFATTELGRVPETIQGRCQIYHLRKIPPTLIAERLSFVCKAENITYESRAIEALALVGRGSMRDALTQLDQAIARGAGQVRLSDVSGAQLIAARHRLLSFVSSLVHYDLHGIIEQLGFWDDGGQDLAEVVEEAAKLCRHAFVLRHLGPGALKTELLGFDPGEEAHLRTLASEAGDVKLNELFNILAHCRHELQGTTLDRFILENTCFEWCLSAKKSAGHESATTSTPSTAASLTIPSAQKGAGTVPSVPIVVSSLVTEEEESNSFPTDWANLVERWKRLKPLQGRILEDAYVLTYSSQQIVIAVKRESMAAGKLLQPESQRRISEEFQQLFSFDGSFKVIIHEENTSAPTDTLLETKQRDRAEEQAEIMSTAEKHPLTQEGLRLFGGTINISTDPEQR